MKTALARFLLALVICIAAYPGVAWADDDRKAHKFATLPEGVPLIGAACRPDG